MPAPRFKADLPYGFMKDQVGRMVRHFGPGREFTQLEAWENLPRDVQDTIIDAYPSATRAFEAFCLAMNKFDLQGFRRLSIHKNGATRYVWTPPAAPAPQDTLNGVGSTKTFTLVGYTSDSKPLFRDDETGRLGWFDWEDL